MMVDISQYKRWTAEEFERVFPLPEPPVSSRSNGGGGNTGGIDDADESTLPDDLMEWIRDGVPQSQDRSRMFMAVVAALKELGFTLEGVYKLLARYPDGIAQKYTKPKDRLRKETERAYNKIPAPAAPSPPVSAPASPAVLSSALSQPLAEAHATFKTWLGEQYDTDILDAVVSTAAAERLGGDPLWLMVVAGSGGDPSRRRDLTHHEQF
jgi:hypothetical protein